MFGSHLLVEIMPCVLAAAAFFGCLLCTTSLQHVLGRTGVAAGGVFPPLPFAYQTGAAAD